MAEYGVEGALRHHLALSMENLQTDYVDLYYLHRVNEDMALSDVSLAMGKLIAGAGGCRKSPWTS